LPIYGPKKNVAFTLHLPLLNSGNGDFLSTPALAAGDFQVAGDDGAFANLATLPSVTPASGRWIKIALSASEMNADIVKVQCVDQTNPKEWQDTGEVIFTTAQGIGASVPQTGDSYARLGAPAGASVSADIALLQADTDNIQTRLPAVLVGGRMDVSVGAFATAVLDAAALAADAAAEIADAYLDRADAIDGYTPRQKARLELAALAGKSSGGTATGASNPVFRAANDSKARISATVDANGNRTAVTLDAT
jgi:hypothetical protein